MKGRQKPRVGYEHIGADARYLSQHLDTEYSGMTMKQALAAYERVEHKSLNYMERREFFRGWRQNQVVEPANRLIGLAPYLTAEQLDALGVEVQALADKWYAILHRRG